MYKVDCECKWRTVFYIPFSTTESKRTTTVSYVKIGQMYVFNITTVTVHLNFLRARLRNLHFPHRFMRGFSKGIFTGVSRAFCNRHKTIFTCSRTTCVYLGLSITFLPRWPRGLRRSSAAVRLLGLRTRIPPGALMFVVNVVCCQV